VRILGFNGPKSMAYPREQAGVSGTLILQPPPGAPFCMSFAMSNWEDAGNDLNRLQTALEALAADLDAIERRPHFLLRRSAEPSRDSSHGIEGFVNHFAIVVGKAKSGPKL